jgi:hypothetical protein
MTKLDKKTYDRYLRLKEEFTKIEDVVKARAFHVADKLFEVDEDAQRYEDAQACLSFPLDCLFSDDALQKEIEQIKKAALKQKQEEREREKERKRRELERLKRELGED